jgi:hypothetical protein
MGSDRPVPSFVIRMSDVRLSQQELETVLGIALDRYEPSRHGALHYAQVCMAHDAADWSAVAEFLELIGPRIKELSDRRAIGAATMDFHLPFWDNKIATSSTLPARIALLAGQNLIDIETSVYLTSSEG